MPCYNEYTFNIIRDILVNSMIQKISDDDKYDENCFLHKPQVFEDPTFHKQKRVGFYTFAEYKGTKQNIASSIDCKLDQLFIQKDDYSSYKIIEPILKAMAKTIENYMNAIIKDKIWTPWSKEKRISVIRLLEPEYNEDCFAKKEKLF